MLKIKYTAQFKKDYKKAISKGCNIKDLTCVINLLMNREMLPVIYKAHKLNDSRNYKNARECHIKPDWLLIYQVEDEELILKLIRTGSHSEVFK